MKLTAWQRLKLGFGIKPELPPGFSIPDGQVVQSPRCDRCRATLLFGALEQHARWHAAHDGRTDTRGR